MGARSNQRAKRQALTPSPFAAACIALHSGLRTEGYQRKRRRLRRDPAHRATALRNRTVRNTEASPENWSNLYPRYSLCF